MKNLVFRLSFTIFKIALAILPLLIWWWFFEYQQVRWLSKLTALIFQLTIILLLEVTRRTDDKSTPFYKMIGRFSTLRDRLVSLIAFVLFLLLLYMPLFLNFTWQMGLITAGFAMLINYFVRFIFGTQELRESLKPNWPEIW
jgi:hypothetical protein